MRLSQIIAIDRVAMEAPPAARERLIWFYRDLVGLTFVEDTLNQERLRFKSAELELRVLLRDEPRLEQSRRRAVVSVECLETTIAVLDEERIPYQGLSGLNGTDRRVALLDPGGNRVELKQEWRRGVFPTPEERAREERRRTRQEVIAKKSKNGADTDGADVYSN